MHWSGKKPQSGRPLIQDRSMACPLMVVVARSLILGCLATILIMARVSYPDNWGNIHLDFNVDVWCSTSCSTHPYSTISNLRKWATPRTSLKAGCSRAALMTMTYPSADHNRESVHPGRNPARRLRDIYFWPQTVRPLIAERNIQVGDQDTSSGYICAVCCKQESPYHDGETQCSRLAAQ